MSRYLMNFLFVWAMTLLLAPTAKADPITFNFEGIISSHDSDPLGCLADGNTFSGSYTFESLTVDQDASPNRGEYPQSGANTMTLTFNASCDFTFNFDVIVENNLPADAYRLNNNQSIFSGAFEIAVNIDLVDQAGLVFNNDNLPLSPPDLSAFADALDTNEIIIEGASGEDSFEFNGELISLTPEPTAISFVAIGSLILLLPVRRRR